MRRTRSSMLIQPPSYVHMVCRRCGHFEDWHAMDLNTGLATDCTLRLAGRWAKEDGWTTGRGRGWTCLSCTEILERRRERWNAKQTALA